MYDKTAKTLRWVIAIAFLCAVALNMIWPGGGPRWAYWASWFLIAAEVLVLGIAFIAFPKAMMRLVMTNRDTYNRIPPSKLVLSGLIAGIPLLVVGAIFLALAIRSWLAECSNYLSCLK